MAHSDDGKFRISQSLIGNIRRLDKQRIIKILNPKKFWRYDVVNKQFKNVVERMGY